MEGAKGRNRSRILILLLMMSRMSARRGSATMLRWPRARAPHSTRPWNQPTTCPWATRSAAQRARSSRSSRGTRRQPARSSLRCVRASWTAVASKCGPHEGEALEPGAALDRPEEVEGRLLEDRLRRGRDRLVSWLEVILRATRGPEQGFELGGEDAPHHGLAALPGHVDAARVVAEVAEVETECPVVLQADEPPEGRREVGGAVGGQAHHLVLVAVLHEAEILRDGEIEHSERMREMHATEDVETIAVARAPGGAHEIAEAVDGAHGRFLPRRDEEGAREVGGVVLDPVHAGAHVPRRQPEGGRGFLRGVFHAPPVGGAILDETDRGAVERGVEGLLPEVGARIARDGDGFDREGLDARHAEAGLDGLRGKAGPVLDASEPLLGYRGDQPSIHEKRGCRVSVVRADAENRVHEPGFLPWLRRPAKF